jgi:hypothetical protein
MLSVDEYSRMTFDPAHACTGFQKPIVSCGSHVHKALLLSLRFIAYLIFNSLPWIWTDYIIKSLRFLDQIDQSYPNLTK